MVNNHGPWLISPLTGVVNGGDPNHLLTGMILQVRILTPKETWEICPSLWRFQAIPFPTFTLDDMLCGRNIWKNPKHRERIDWEGGLSAFQITFSERRTCLQWFLKRVSSLCEENIDYLLWGRRPYLVLHLTKYIIQSCSVQGIFMFCRNIWSSWKGDLICMLLT